MTSCRQLSNEFCRGTCGRDTLHNEIGCVHWKTCGGVRVVSKKSPPPTDWDKDRTNVAAVGVDSLSVLERRVLAEFAVGGSPGAVGKRLGLTARAVRSHRSRICEKLNLTFQRGNDVVTEFARNLGAQRLIA